jgi:hypothetical protein
MSKVYVKFPKTGLGNLLLIWARAYVFSEINHLPLVASSWWAFRWGAWLRNEKKKRFYFGYFKEDSFFNRVSFRFYGWMHKVIYNPSVRKLTQNNNDDCLYLFNKVSDDTDLFGCLREHEQMIRKKIYEMLSPKLEKELSGYTVPIISAHIRRGDFKKGNPITPESFFINCIKEIRSSVGEDWPITIFTDAGEWEIENVLSLPHAHIAKPKADILDILLMSKSKVIITSRSSTFSYWAAFLSDAVVIRPEGDWQKTIKVNQNNYFELPLDVNNNKVNLNIKEENVFGSLIQRNEKN